MQNPGVPKKKMRQREVKRATSFAIEPSLMGRLRKIADEKDRSLSYLVSQAIREFLERVAA